MTVVKIEKQESKNDEENSAIEKIKLLKEFVKIQSSDKEIYHNYTAWSRDEVTLLKSIRRLEYLITDANVEELRSAVKLYKISIFGG